ncbi:hypothetical protein [Streptomyces sp. ME19-01-6]|uniref:hypothetical protein n=1 Tax=Streptomyces sp. ME19-01-6 TaxID=3028686 RepID=UPI0029A08E0F|nr:hypothetical protein [Streptomyces sp. ME19-01-6]MDX3224670.1 hypothetical protein [Streptomyces sp. ME19-01-6]
MADPRRDQPHALAAVSLPYSRTSPGAETIRVRIWLMGWVRDFTAERRTTRRERMASTIPSRVLGVPPARPDRTAVAAA